MKHTKIFLSGMLIAVMSTNIQAQLLVPSGQINMQITPDDHSWRSISANTTLGQLALSVGGASSTGPTIEMYSAGSTSRPGRIHYITYGASSTDWGEIHYNYIPPVGSSLASYNAALGIQKNGNVVIGNDWIGAATLPTGYSLYVEQGILADKLTTNGNATINGGQIDMTIPGDGSWRNINANTNNKGLTLQSGTGGAFILLHGTSNDQPGAMEFLAGGTTSSGDNGFSFINLHSAVYTPIMHLYNNGDASLYGYNFNMVPAADNKWRTINANTINKGLSLQSGTGGAFILLHGASNDQPGAMEFIASGSASTLDNGISFLGPNPSGLTSALQENMHIFNNGKVVIGSTIIPDGTGSESSIPDGYNLYVTKGILTEKLNVAIAGTGNWSDFVFNKDYHLMPLGTLESYVHDNKHLPEVPAASDVAKDGIDVPKMDAKLLQKIEELTLYVIEQQKQLTLQQKEIEELKSGPQGN